MRDKVLLIVLLTIVFAGTSWAQEVTESPESEPIAEATEQVEVTPGAVVVSPAEVTEEPLANAIPPEIAAHSEQWPLAHKDYRNTRATFDSLINSSNVHQLDVAWSFAIPGRANFGAAASAPLIAGNVVYFQDLASNTYAFDLRTGARLWEKTFDNPVIGPNGPAIGYAKVFVISGVDTFSALNIETGEEEWSVTTGNRPTGAFQPYAFNNKLFMTTQAGVGGEGDQTYRGYAGGTSGHIYALDVETGNTIWEFQTVEEGFWGNAELNSGGGVWFSPAIDTDTGWTFWGTGNPAPFPGTFDYPNASSRPEPNLYANSMLAVDHETGELIWYNYANPNDLFDHDLQNSPILASVNFRGEQRNVVIGSGKLGEVIAFDRQTGEMIWRTPVGIHQNDDLTELPPGESIVVYPGILGGVETPMAYADGTVYAPVLNLPTTHTATSHGARTGTEALENADANTPTGQGTSELVALNASTGQILWSHEFPSGNYGGATVVNDLVFTATFDGTIYALNRATGQTVWTYQSEAGINAWPAVAGDTIIWPAGFGDNPSLVALRLGGAQEGEVTAEATAEMTAEATEGAEVTEEATPVPAAEETAEATESASGEETQEATAKTGDEAAGGGGAQDSEYLTVDAENQTVNLTIIAAEDSSNGGLNFNGYANGNATFTVPVGWTVNIHYENASNLPHSALIVARDAIEQESPQPVFEGAATSEPYSGTTEPEDISFTASEEGNYVVACGVPGHASRGQWIHFIVGAADVQPSYQAGG